MSIFRLPKISERDPTGKLISIPGRVEAAATNPINAVGVPKLSAKGFNTGFFDIVELSSAMAPITHRIMNKFFLNDIKDNTELHYFDSE